MEHEFIMESPKLLKIVLEKPYQEFIVSYMYDSKMAHPKKEDARFHCFGTAKGYHIIEKIQDWTDGPVSGRSRDPVNVIPESQDLQEAIYQTSLEYARDLAKLANVPLQDKTGLAKKSG